MDIKDINPWWKSGNVEQRVFPRRDLFSEIIKYIKERQIIAVNGLRRTGKTILMHHLIDFLLKENPKENIIYYNFDLLNGKIEDILEIYQEIVGVNIKKDKVFVFLDEVQKHDNWENEIKTLYDNYKNLKFFISGSSSLLIEKKTKESLGGRIFSFILEPLTFKEYLKLKKVRFDKKRISLFEHDIKSCFKHYLRTGGFPELINLKEGVKIDRYVKELVIDRVVYIDIPEIFEIEEPELLVRILSIVSADPGMIIDYEGLADDLSRNRKTISNYMFYLEKAFLIKRLYNYSKNLLTSEKKLKKVYPTSTALAYLFNAREGKIIENVFLMNCDSKFFSKITGKEVDFIIIDKKILPIEIKYKKSVREKEIKGLIKFLERYKLKQGRVITEDKEGEETIKRKKVEYIPLWKWLLKDKLK